MSPVKIVTDSSAELRDEVAEELDITVVPWRFSIRGSIETDNEGLRTLEMHRRITEGRLELGAMPPTSEQLTEVYERLALETPDIISIHPPLRLASVIRAANRAKSGFLGRCQIKVLSSQFISQALGLLVVEAAKAARSGMSADDVVRHVHGKIPTVYLAFCVETMDQLEQRGLKPDLSILKPALAISRPLLMLEEGDFLALRRTRNRGTPIERMVEFVSEFRKVKHVSVMHTGLSSDASELKSHLCESLPGLAFEDRIYGLVFRSIVGPDALALVVQDAD